jgi:hypothetical protein
LKLDLNLFFVRIQIEARQRKKSEEDSAKKEREVALAQCQKDHMAALQRQMELKVLHLPLYSSSYYNVSVLISSNGVQENL